MEFMGSEESYLELPLNQWLDGEVLPRHQG